MNDFENKPIPIIELPPEKPSKRSNLVYLIFFLIAIIIYLFVQNNQLNSKINSIQSQSVPRLTLIPSPSISVEPTSSIKDWKTYTNAEVKYSVRYPGNWLVNQESAQITYFLTQERNEDIKNKKIVRVFDLLIQNFKTVTELPNNTNNLDLDNWIKQQQKLNLITASNPITIGSLNGYQVTENGEYASYVIYLQNKSLVYRIETNSEEPADIELQIINSIKFN